MRLATLVPVSVRRFVRRVVPRPRLEAGPIWVRSGFKWHLDATLVNENGLAAHAWVAVPRADRNTVVLGIDGRPFPEHDSHERPDVHVDQPHIAKSGYAVVGLTGHSFRPTGGIEPGGIHRIEILDRRTGRPMPNLGPVGWHRIASPSDPPLPDAVRRQRVHGNDAVATFEATGFTVFATLQAILERTTGKTWVDFESILDWGCGSGRVLRYFRDAGTTVTGADVDADNVAWCRRNLPFARCETIPLHPPTAFADGSFDLAFGVSIFTHLSEPVQFEWLAELRRMVRPGGILLMSYHGLNSLACGRITPEQAYLVRRDGFLDVSNHQYDATLAEADYYRNCFHDDDYIRLRWGEFFDIVELVPGALSVQDVAVLRRR
jgi:SAM-dependent methyltransferase